MALGARPGDVFKLVLKQTMKLAGIGLAVALPASFLLGRALSSLLVGVVSMDSATYAAITVLLLLMALAAGHFPARRAARRDPMAALRQE
jgi:putative ABC transport system permease protein